MTTLEQLDWIKTALDEGVIDDFGVLVSFARGAHHYGVPEELREKVVGGYLLSCNFSDLRYMSIGYQRIGYRSKPHWIIIDANSFVIIEQVLEAGIFADFYALFHFWTEATLRLCQSEHSLGDLEELVETEKDIMCRQGQNKGVVYKVTLLKHFEDPTKFILEFQPRERNPGEPHIAG